jgi:hypothetical protein
MLILILVISGTICAFLATSVLLLQEYRIRKELILVDENYDGPKQVSVTLHTVIRYGLKQSIHARKFFMQYVLHAMVRFMYHFDILTTKMYSRSRNWFVKNAVENKGTVPHFWQHLKVYKQEMDQEKEEDAIK